MSITALAWAKRQRVGDPLAKYVLFLLADYYNDAIGQAWPSIHRMVAESELSESSVIRKLEYLEGKGLIQRVQTKSKEKGWEHNRYVLAVTPFCHTDRSLLSHRPHPSVCETPNPLEVTTGSRSGADVLAATPIPPDWTPDPADIAWAERRHPNVELAHEADRFRDHFLSCGHLRRSWPACFREWIRRADRPRPVREGPGRDGQLEARRPRGAAAERDALNRARLARARRELAGDPAPGPGVVEPE